MLNKKSYVATATQASGASDEISGIIQPSLSDGAPNGELLAGMPVKESSTLRNDTHAYTRVRGLSLQRAGSCQGTF